MLIDVPLKYGTAKTINAETDAIIAERITTDMMIKILKAVFFIPNKSPYF